MVDGSTTATNIPTTDSPEQDPVVTVQGGDLPFDVDRVWNRTQALLGVQVPPPRVLVRPHPGSGIGQLGFAGMEFLQTLGVGPPTDLAVSDGLPGGSYTNGDIVIYPRNASADAIEATLVHEFAHHLVWNRPRGLGDSRRAVDEGVAVYVADAYADRYIDGSDPAGEIGDFYRRATGGNRYWFGLYHFGYRYVDGRVDGPKEVRQALQDYPQTAEQLIHGGTPATHPVEPLELQSNTTAARWQVRGPSSRMGELFVRVMLAGALPEEKAARGAAGWGADTVTTFRDPEANETGYLWTIRWDTPADADEFEMVFREFLAEKTGPSDDRWLLDGRAVEVQRHSPKTVVVLTGPVAFVDEAVVSSSNATIGVSFLE